MLYFVSRDNCEYCDETRQLLEEVIALDDRRELKSYDVHDQRDTADKFSVKDAL